MNPSSVVSGDQIAAILDTLATCSFDSVMITEAAPHTPIVYVNEAFSRLTGYSSEEVLGQSPSLLQGPQTDETVLHRLHEDLQAGRVFEGQAINYRKDGSTFTMWWRVAPVLGTDGKPEQYLAVQREGPAR